MSVTVWQTMALRSAKNAGFDVPKEAIDEAVRYIKRCYHPRTGGFSYMPGTPPGFARTAAGVCVLYLTGQHKSKEIPGAVKYLKENFDARQHYWYGHYYASHAMHQVGGKDWKEWYEKMIDKFLPIQKPDGSWSGKDHSSPGPVYDTSIAVMALSVPMNYLPIYQR